MVARLPRIDVVTTARADYSLILPVARAIARRSDVAARVVYTGSHFSRNEREGLDRAISDWGGDAAQVPCTDIGESLRSSGTALGEMTSGFARLWAGDLPDVAVLLGDRFEILAPAGVAVINGIPIAHLYGGEEDVSCCFDTQVRNGVTKMAHVHLVMHEAQRQRLLRMGEESWRIHVVGNSAIEEIDGHDAKAARAFLDWAAGIGLDDAPLIAACYMPATAFPGIWRNELRELFAALDTRPEANVIWAGVNADPESPEIQAAIEAHCESHRRHRFIANLGRLRFYGLLQQARVLIGNSSSGLLEAASFGLPAVNVGVRQTGRLCGANVINTPAERGAISAALSRAVDDAAYRKAVATGGNPFSVKGTCSMIATLLAAATRMERLSLLLKRYSDGNPAFDGPLQRVRELQPYSELHGSFGAL